MTLPIAQYKGLVGWAYATDHECLAAFATFVADPDDPTLVIGFPTVDELAALKKALSRMAYDAENLLDFLA